MTQYSTRQELESAYAESLDCDKSIATLIARDKAVYVPHKYRGGFVIRGFGYSVERIGVYIKKENSGDPRIV